MTAPAVRTTPKVPPYSTMANEVPLQQARPQALDWAGHVIRLDWFNSRSHGCVIRSDRFKSRSTSSMGRRKAEKITSTTSTGPGTSVLARLISSTIINYSKAMLGGKVLPANIPTCPHLVAFHQRAPLLCVVIAAIWLQLPTHLSTPKGWKAELA